MRADTNVSPAPAAPPVPSPSARPTDRIPALDGLRGVAILVVMVFHFCQRFPQRPRGDAGAALFFEVAAIGWCGVDLFFVLSGFLITGILWDTRQGSHYFRSFYARRFLRIFPLYYAVVLVMVLLPSFLAPPQAAVIAPVRHHQPWYWTYTTNVLLAVHGRYTVMPRAAQPMWSLAVEEQFYLLWPLVVWRLKRTTLMRVCVVSMLASLAFRVLGASYGVSRTITYASLPARADVLLAGAFVALWLRGPIDWSRALRTARIVAAMAAGSLVAIAVVRGDLRPEAPVVYTAGFTAFAILFAACVALAARPGRRGMLAGPILGLAGTYSYAMYLFHVPVDEVLHRSGATAALAARLPGPVWLALAQIAVGGLVTTALAVASWHLYEKHFLRLKRLFPYG
jgi:peptidoglycan/LPS O-acetylase OafA/YrhL